MNPEKAGVAAGGCVVMLLVAGVKIAALAAAVYLVARFLL